jgi:hypothetical protein
MGDVDMPRRVGGPEVFAADDDRTRGGWEERIGADVTGGPSLAWLLDDIELI